MIASMLLQDPDRVLEIVLRNLARDLETGNTHSEKYTREWDRLLKQDIPSLIDSMLDPSDHGVTLRSCTPFTGISSRLARSRRLSGSMGTTRNHACGAHVTEIVSSG